MLQYLYLYLYNKYRLIFYLINYIVIKYNRMYKVEIYPNDKIRYRNKQRLVRQRM